MKQLNGNDEITFVYTVRVNGQDFYHGVNAVDAINTVIAWQGHVFADKIEVQRNAMHTQHAMTDLELFEELTKV